MDREFDLSDVQPPSDTLSEILGVCVEVMLDYGGEGEHRIQRLARWISGTLDSPPDDLSVLTPFAVNDQSGLCWVQVPGLGHLRPDMARSVAAAILHCADEAELEH